MTSTVRITNLDDVQVRKYGRTFGPGEWEDVPIEVMNAYSLAEISKALQYIVKYMPRQQPKVMQSHQIIPVRIEQNFHDKLKETRFGRWKRRRKTKKLYKQYKKESTT